MPILHNVFSRQSSIFKDNLFAAFGPTFCLCVEKYVTVDTAIILDKCVNLSQVCVLTVKNLVPFICFPCSY